MSKIAEAIVQGETVTLTMLQEQQILRTETIGLFRAALDQHSTDAAISLVGLFLPGWLWYVTSRSDCMIVPPVEFAHIGTFHHRAEPLSEAIVVATLRAHAAHTKEKT